jgi:integrase
MEETTFSTSQKLPFAPEEKELNSLIACSGKKISTMLQLLKETGVRSGEALRLKWVDVDQQRKTITVNTPEEHSNPRIRKVSTLLIDKLNGLPKDNEYMFANRLRQSLNQNFEVQRKRIATRPENPRPLRISFKTFRHWNGR